MRTLLLTLTLFLGTLSFSSAQKIESETTVMKTHYYYKRERVNTRQLVRIMEQVPEAQHLMKAGRSQKIFGNVIGFIGGFMVGYEAGMYFRNRYSEPNIGILAIGGSMMVASIATSIASSKSIKKAVKKFNATVEPETSRSSLRQVDLIANGSGIGFRFSF